MKQLIYLFFLTLCIPLSASSDKNLNKPSYFATNPLFTLSMKVSANRTGYHAVKNALENFDRLLFPKL